MTLAHCDSAESMTSRLRLMFTLRAEASGSAARAPASVTFRDTGSDELLLPLPWTRGALNAK